MCANGVCTNMDGSFKCQCKEGYVLSPTGHACIGTQCQLRSIIITLFKIASLCKTRFQAELSSARDSLYGLAFSNSTDQDECYENPRICLSGRCENTPGSYKCTCLNGFTPSVDQTFCVDVWVHMIMICSFFSLQLKWQLLVSLWQKDECADTGMCENGRCLNMDGSFKCVCNPGYKLGPTGKHCIGT